jgi:G:T/U-mismatch repair DNA glycosylase
MGANPGLSSKKEEKWFPSFQNKLLSRRRIKQKILDDALFYILF